MTTKKRYTLPTDSQPAYGYTGQEETLPTHLPIAVYYRQSSDHQIGNQSTYMQQEDLPEMLVARGWKRENIIMISDDAGISGTKSFDERKGARRLVRLIQNKEIGAVCVIDVSRLTRDEWGIDANVYIKMCATAEVVTVTPSWTFVFHGRSANFHIRQFRHQAEYAAEHITYHIRERLIPAKARKHRNGEYIGGSRVPLGFCISDKDKFTPFPPYADYIRMYFQIILDCHGNMAEVLRRIIDGNLYLPRYDSPDVLAELPPGCKLVISKQNADHDRRRIMQWTERGYVPTREVLTRMATNVVYLGWWVVKGEIISKDNHSPIVDSVLFWDVYNLINPYSATGGANPNFNPHGHRLRKRTGKEGRSERPLLHGLIYHESDIGKRLKAQTVWDKDAGTYNFHVSKMEQIDFPVYEWQKQYYIIEHPILDMLKARIDSTRAEEIQDADTSYRQRREEQLSLLRMKRHEIEASIDTAIGNIALVTDHSLIPHLQKVVQGLKDQLASVKAQIAELDADTNVTEQLIALKNQIAVFSEQWDTLTYAQRLKAVQLYVDHIVTRWVGKDLRIEVIWADAYHHDGTTYMDATTFMINGRRGTNGWLQSELDTLRDCIERGVSRPELLAALPKRTLGAIRFQAHRMLGGYYRIGKPLKVGGEDNPVSESLSERKPTKAVILPIDLLALLAKRKSASKN